MKQKALYLQFITKVESRQKFCKESTLYRRIVNDLHDAVNNDLNKRSDTINAFGYL